MPPPPLLEARGIRKEFPGVVALDGVSMTLAAGEVLALVGENGAGKSTLMKILAGVYQPDAGELLLDGRQVAFPNVQTANAAGVSLIHQELNLAENLSVSANIFLGREITKSPLKLLDNATMRAEAVKVVTRVGLPEAMVDFRVSSLAPGQKQLVEIARALAVKARVIIMDEPTSSLTQSETDRLYEVIDELRRNSIAVVYISHRLAEVKRVSDRAIILRDGRNAGELPKAEINHENLVKLMVGREMKSMYPRSRPPTTNSQPILRLREITWKGGPATPVSLDLFPGEVLGMAGLVGAGRTELAEAVFGLRPLATGRIELNGQAVTLAHPKQAMQAGLAMVPEDRRHHGLHLAEGSGFNIALTNLARISTAGLVNNRHAKALGQHWLNALRVRTPSLRQPVGLLSGGNQQKVVFGKWLAREPKVLILDEPTRGVDVGARGEIYTIIDDLAARGLAVWMISSDLEEILGMSDRVAVLHEGRLSGIVSQAEMTEETIMTLATGGPRP
ncbi:sugar ABC transporter ATP-binding protein [soil metagenome]